VNLTLPSVPSPVAAETSAFPTLEAAASPCLLAVPGAPFAEMLAMAETLAPAAPAADPVPSPANQPFAAGVQAMPSGCLIAPWVTKGPKATVGLSEADEDPVKPSARPSDEPDPISALISGAISGGVLPQALPVEPTAVGADPRESPAHPAATTITSQDCLGESKSDAADFATPPSLPRPAAQLPVSPPYSAASGDFVSPRNGTAKFPDRLSPLPRPAGDAALTPTPGTAPAAPSRTSNPVPEAMSSTHAATCSTDSPIGPTAGLAGNGEDPFAAPANPIGTTPTNASPLQAPDPVPPPAGADTPFAPPPRSIEDRPAIASDAPEVVVAQSTAAVSLAAVSQVPGGNPENFAARTGMKRPPARLDASTGSSEPRRDAILNPSGQQLKDSSPFVGIGSAQSSAAMRKPAESSAPVRLLSTPGADGPRNEAVGPIAASAEAPFTVDRHSSQLAPFAEPAVPHAAAAVEAALNAVERVRDAGHTSVELKLSFGDDTRLAVRVEFRDGAVHTTFRTDSADLRQALASQWREAAPAVFAAAPDRSVRVADPVFTTASGSLDTTGTSTGGEANSRHAATPDSAPELFRPSASGKAMVPASMTPAAPASFHASTSVRLNTFA
jgi:hypothetical protein